MSVNLSPIFNGTQFKSDGTLASGYKIYTYAEGSSTPLATYTTSLGDVPQANPIVLNARGEPPSQIWLTSGAGYKLVLTTDLGAIVVTEDNIRGVNDTTSSVDQWLVSGLTPTYVGATQFTLVGDQTTAFHVGRRIKLLVSAGTIYGTITASAYGAVTTITVKTDSGAIDAGISSVSVGLITATNGSLPTINYSRMTVAATATTTPLWASTNVQDWSGTPTITAFPAASQAGSQRIVYPAAGTIITHGGSISVQGSANYTTEAGDELTITAVTTSTFTVAIKKASGYAVTQQIISSKIQPITAIVGSSALTITLNATNIDFRSATLGSGTVNTRQIASPISVVVSSGSTLGTVSATQSLLAVLAIDNAGTVELAVVNIAGGNNLDETTLISTTAEGGAGAADSANVIYSTTARASVPFRIVGYVESTQATAGTWATAPSKIQGAGGQALQHIGAITTGTAQATTSGVTVDISGIPNTAKSVTLMLLGVSTNGSSPVVIRLGTAAGIIATGYLTGTIGGNGAGTAVANNTTGFQVEAGSLSAAATVRHGSITFNLYGTDTWVGNGLVGGSNTAQIGMVAGSIALGAPLTQIRITTSNGTDAFDAGAINISYQ